MKVKPTYLMPADATHLDEIIEENFAHWNAVVDRKGEHAAKMEVVASMIAAASWLEDMFGSRQAYILFQQAADALLTPTIEKSAA